MGVKYLKPGQDFGGEHFPSDFGFKGSSAQPQHHAMGGRHHAMGKSAPPAAGAGGSEPMISMPMSTAGRIAKGLVGVGALQAAHGAGPGAPPMPQRPAMPPVGGPPPGGPPMAAPGAPPMPGGGAGPAMAKGGHMTAAKRNSLPKSDFALPGERYPINDPSHARNALSRVSQNGSPSEQSRVRGAVHRKYPDIGKKD